jgi:hypothetical protein
LRYTPVTAVYHPQTLKDIISDVSDYIDLILDDKKESNYSELEEVEGFIEDINKKRHEISEGYKAIAEADELLKELNEKFTTQIKPLLDRINAATKRMIQEKSQKEKTGDNNTDNSNTNNNEEDE